MISKNRIVHTALTKLGEVGVYNDNKSDLVVVATALLDNVLDDLATRADFLFNSQTSRLNLNSQKLNDFGEYRYNIPSDFKNKIRFVKGRGRIEAEFIYSFDEEVVLRYCRTISISEIPEYLSTYITFSLAVELAESYSQYEHRLQLMNTRREEEKQKIYAIEFTPSYREV